jgi:DNA-binding NtrC family response regulator
MRLALEASFRHAGWRVRTASGKNEALAAFRAVPTRLVVTDMRMPDGNGLEVMKGVRAAAPNTAVILLTAFGSVPDAVAAMKQGACDYLIKPVSFEHLKQSIARFIHNASSRREGPFVAVNCAAFPEHLLESELFGHVRGAFTGALGAKPGKFELANHGTLLLDEIGEMPLSLQPKLLRVLQEREVDRLGDTKSTKVDVRVVATTNRSLKDLAQEGLFRMDLYYRLNVIPICIVPLRERREDIPELANYFLRKHAVPGRPPLALSDELLERLATHSWPGNVREFENFIRRVLALSPGALAGLEVLDGVEFDTSAGTNNAIQPGVTLREMERQLVEKTLEATGGNRTRAADMLGVSLRTIRNKIREYGLPPREVA